MKRFFKEILILLISAAIAIVVGNILMAVLIPNNAGLASFAFGFMGLFSMPIIFVISYFIIRRRVFSIESNKKAVFISFIVTVLLVMIFQIYGVIKNHFENEWRIDYDHDIDILEALSNGGSGNSCAKLVLPDFEKVCEAIVTGNIDACKTVSEVGRKIGCWELVTFRTGDLDACKSYFSDSERFQNECETVYNNRLKRLSLIDKDASFCGKIINSDYKIECFDDLAIYTHNLSLCQSDGCKQLFNRGYDYCFGDQKSTINCHSKVLFLNQNLDECFKASKVYGGLTIIECVDKLAMYTHDSKVCDRLLDRNDLLKCKWRFDDSPEIPTIFNLPSQKRGHFYNY